jgi:hypothetical protein
VAASAASAAIMPSAAVMTSATLQAVQPQNMLIPFLALLGAAGAAPGAEQSAVGLQSAASFSDWDRSAAQMQVPMEPLVPEMTGASGQMGSRGAAHAAVAPHKFMSASAAARAPRGSPTAGSAAREGLQGLMENAGNLQSASSARPFWVAVSDSQTLPLSEMHSRIEEIMHVLHASGRISKRSEATYVNLWSRMGEYRQRQAYGILSNALRMMQPHEAVQHVRTVLAHNGESEKMKDVQ